MSFAPSSGLSRREGEGRRPTIILVITGRIVSAQIPALCERARGLLEEADGDQVVCDVSHLSDPDGAAVDALARLQLTARRCGREIRLLHPSAELQELLTLSGLDAVIPQCAASGVEPRRQPEQREQTIGIEEERDPGDPLP